MAAVAILVATPGFAAKPKKPAGPPFDAKGVAAELTSGDGPRIVAALERVHVAGKDAAALAPVIDRLLERGLPPEVAKAALAAEGDLAAPASLAVVRPYARHRDAELRRAAVVALQKIKGKDAVTALREALADGDPRVRGTAASGLGALGAKEALPDLDAALDRKVYEAAAAIGQLCEAAQCDSFEARLGKVPLDVMTSGFDAILFRGDVSEEHKTKLIGRVRELGTGEANKYLKDVASRWTGSARVKSALDQAAQATEGAPGSTP